MKISRRNFVVSTSATTAGLAVGCSTLAGRFSEGWIDAHVHVWTPDVKSYPLAPGYRPERMNPRSFTPEELFALSRPEGGMRILLIQMSYYQFDNTYMLDMMRKHAGVFSGVALLDESLPDVRGRLQALVKQGVRGIRLRASKANAEKWPESAGMKELWQAGADLGVAMCPLGNPDALPAIRRMSTAYPETTVVIDHFARIGVKGSIDQNDLDSLKGLADLQNTYVKTSAFYALGKKQAPYTDLGPMIRQLRDAYGAERLMWATDCPFQAVRGHTYAESIALVRDRLDFLTANDKDWILRKTAEKVFFPA
jgi:predicted TIM-barrel fold metal-dependent hydrolase